MMAIFYDRDDLLFKCARKIYQLERSVEIRRRYQKLLDSLKSKYAEFQRCFPPFSTRLLKRAVKGASRAATTILADNDNEDDVDEDKQGDLARNLPKLYDNLKAFARIDEIKEGLAKQDLKKDEMMKRCKEDAAALERNNSITDRMRELVQLVEKLYPDYKKSLPHARFRRLQTRVEEIVDDYEIEIQRLI